MIDSRILHALKSRNANPGYSILITDYEVKEDCSQEKLIITLHQINKSLRDIETMDENVSVLKKELVIQSDMDYDSENNAIKTTLTGFSNYKSKVDIPKKTDDLSIIENGTIIAPEYDDDIFSHKIEMIETPLRKEIFIDFAASYTITPAIIITIDKKYKSYYKNYDIEFQQNQKSQYTGATITFNKLKRKQSYPNINITIIGDKILPEG